MKDDSPLNNFLKKTGKKAPESKKKKGKDGRDVIEDADDDVSDLKGSDSKYWKTGKKAKGKTKAAAKAEKKPYLKY